MRRECAPAIASKLVSAPLTIKQSQKGIAPGSSPEEHTIYEVFYALRRCQKRLKRTRTRNVRLTSFGALPDLAADFFISSSWPGSRG